VAHRLALVTLAATFVLILFGGLVTDTGAALAVPDWPSTFGYNLFFYPWSQMVGGIFYEHSHRLIGAAVGLLTLGLAAALWGAGGWFRWLGLAAVVAVVAQGVLGGLRVVLLEDTLAIVHGSLAQAFFGLLSAIAFLTSRAAERPLRDPGPSLRALTLTAAVVVYLQIVLGALVTHAGWLALHWAGALAVFAVVPVVTARLRRSGGADAPPMASMLLGLLALQLLLGVGSYLGRFSSVWIPGEQTTMLVLPVAHRLVASLILGATVVLAVWVTRTGPARLERARTSPGRTAGAERSQVAPGSGHPRSVPASPIPGVRAGAERSQVAPGSGHPRSVPASRTPLQ